MRKLSRQTATFILLIGLFLQNCNPNQSIEQAQSSRETVIIGKKVKSDRQEQEETLFSVEEEERVVTTSPTHEETHGQPYHTTSRPSSHLGKRGSITGAPQPTSLEFVKRGSKILNKSKKTEEANPLLPKPLKKLLTIERNIQQEDNVSNSGGSSSEEGLYPGSREDDYDEEPELEEVKTRLIKAEQRPAYVKWVYMDHLLEKIAYSLVLKSENVTGVSQKGCHGPDFLWMEGRGIPLKEGYSTARAISGFRQGVEFVLKRSLSLTLQGLLGYQIISQIYKHKTLPILPILKIIWEGDKQSIQGVLAFIVQHPERAPYYLSLFSAPLLWGVIKAVLFARRAIGETPENFKSSIQVIESFSYSSKKTCGKSFWEDHVKWLLPLHPVGREINYLVYRLLLDGKLTLQERERGVEALLNFTRNTHGWSRIAGLGALQKLAAGAAFKQLSRVEEAFGKNYKEALSKEKVYAFQGIYNQNTGIRKAGIRGLVHNLYAHYLRWTLGDFDGWKSAAVWSLFKVGMVGVQINLFIKIAQQVISYLNCPKPLQQGFTYAMQPAGYTSSYNSQCLLAYLRNFNKVPGQPAETILSILPNFQHLDPTLFTTLNFSGQGATGAQLNPIIQALQQKGLTISSLDLSDNTIGYTAEDMEALFPLPTSLTYLDLSRNSIGVYNDNSAAILGKALPTLTRLKCFKLTGIRQGRGLGYLSNEGTIAIGDGLRALTNLQYLDLSVNSIGGWGVNGTVSIGNSLHFLTNLQYLDLSYNYIDNIGGDNGTVAIGNGLHGLTNLQHLDLAHNYIGGDNGIAAIGDGLGTLTNLLYFSLSFNGIGVSGDKGVIAIGNGLHSLKNLQYLDFKANWIGKTENNGTIAIVDSLRTLTRLSYLDISRNLIGGPSNTYIVTDLVDNLSNIKLLENLYVYQWDASYFPPSELNRLRQYWNHKNNNTDLYCLASLEDVQAYLDNLPKNATTISLSNCFNPENTDVVEAFMSGLGSFPSVQYLDLSKNYIGAYKEESITAIGNGLHFLPSLQYLDLSYNGFEWSAQETTSTIAIAKGLSSLTDLRYLNLARNEIGWGATDNGAIAIGNSLHFLTKLEYLDLSLNAIGHFGVGGAIAVGNGLQSLKKLKSLDLSINDIGYIGDSGVVSIGNGLRSHTDLQYLNFNSNHMGSVNDTGTTVIAETLPSLISLRFLGLAHNPLGYNASLALHALSNALPSLLCKGVVCNTLDTGLTTLPWDQMSRKLGTYYSSQIQRACEVNQCFGTPVAMSDNEYCIPSSASSLSPLSIFKLFNFFGKNERPALTYPVLSEEVPMGTALVPYQPIQPPSRWESLQEKFGWRSCHPQAKDAFSSSSANLFLTSAVKGAASTFVLEMMRDGLEHKQVSRHVSHKALMLTQAGLVIYTTTSLIPTMVGMAVNSGLASIGVSSPISAALGSTVAIATSLINGDVVTPIGLAASLAGGLAGSMLALRVKDKIASWLWGSKTESQVSTEVKAS